MKLMLWTVSEACAPDASLTLNSTHGVISLNITGFSRLTLSSGAGRVSGPATAMVSSGLRSPLFGTLCSDGIVKAMLSSEVTSVEYGA